ncbi:uncharacterized protein LOC128681444 [Plodia interpunctella]|uniref:uncharacterized protein LOC128681444 n=1 Tax=Plodia interpunctella TaxID=58824 RepID=UPI0023689957|nr:uncharacterized protein LOC128681444 [Plodia interpunctella]
MSSSPSPAADCQVRAENSGASSEVTGAPAVPISPITRQPLVTGQHTTEKDKRAVPGPSKLPKTSAPKKAKKVTKSPPKGAMEVGRSWALAQSAKKKTKTGGLRRAVVIKGAQAAARRGQIDDARNLADVSVLEASQIDLTQPPDTPNTTNMTPSSAETGEEKPNTTTMTPSSVETGEEKHLTHTPTGEVPPTTPKSPETPEPPMPTHAPPKHDHYSIVISTTSAQQEESPESEASDSQEKLSNPVAWEEERPEAGWAWHGEEFAERRQSILPPLGPHRGVSKDMATDAARDYYQKGKDAVESSKTLKRELRATAVECMGNLFEIVLALAESRSRHRLNLELERTRATKYMVSVERAHQKALQDQQAKFDARLKEMLESLKGTQSSVENVQSWLNFEMDGVVTKSVKTVHLEMGQKSTPAPNKKPKRARLTRRHPLRSNRAAKPKLSEKLQDLTNTVGSLVHEVHYLKTDTTTIRERSEVTPQSPTQQETDESSFKGIKEEVKELRLEMERMLREIRSLRPVSKEEIGDEIREVTAPLMTKAKRILDGVEEVKDVALSNSANNTGPGLGAELAIADTAAQIEGMLNPIRAEVSEIATNSRKTMEWYNSSVKNAAIPTAPPMPKQQARDYAAVAKTPKPQKNPNHTLIISSTDPTNTGEKVLEIITQTLDFKNTGVIVDRVRKARNSKILLSCEDKEDARKLQSQIKKNASLKVQEAKPQNPLIKVNNIMAYLKDEEMVEHIKAQNRKLFEKLPGDQQHIRLRYRKRARNPLQCHAVFEVAPLLHKRMLEEGKIHIAIHRRDVEDQSPLVQCAKCLGFGHPKALCRESAQYCNYCGGAHSWQECRTRQEERPPKCKNCKDAKAHDIFPHMAFSEECPERLVWDRLARSKIAYC